MRRLTGVLVVVMLAGCGGADKFQAGEECVATSQCASGLICDYGQTPHVCATEGTDIPDAAPGAPDGAPAPDSTPGAPDANPPPPDANPVVPDAGPPDAML